MIKTSAKIETDKDWLTIGLHDRLVYGITELTEFRTEASMLMRLFQDVTDREHTIVELEQIERDIKNVIKADENIIKAHLLIENLKTINN